MANKNERIKEGYIVDYISGEQVRGTLEEIEAVQVFSKQLVKDYGYNKTQIQTRPQYKVRKRPSDPHGTYPVDIAIFNNDRKKDDELYIIVECKSPTKTEGRNQLEDYLRFSKAKLGVWFNGEERFFLRKYEFNGEILFEEIPNIPIKGQKIEDIGQFKRKDLKNTHNLKPIFISIRNHLAANAVGTTRDESLAKEIINLILCKLFDEKYTKPNDIVQFRAGINESSEEVGNRIKKRFNETKQTYGDILENEDKISLDDDSIKYIVGELQNYCLIDVERDIVSDAFEVFIQKALKGGKGQFFTPKNVVKTAVEIINPKIDDKIIDPACGSGSFLIESLKFIHKKIEKKGKEHGWSEQLIDREKFTKASQNLKGIEKDEFLTKIAKAYMILIGDGKGGIFCEDSLQSPEKWKLKPQNDIKLGTFDIVLTNPPFGSKIPVKGKEKLSQYEFGHKWKENKRKTWKKGKLKDKVPPQILFIERCLELLKEGGKMGIVLPDGILSNPTDGYIVQYLLKHTEILGIIDLPKNTFLPYTSTKTHLLFLKKTKKPRKHYDLFMSYAKTCGHDRRGYEIDEDEIRLIPEHLKKIEETTTFNRLGFKLKNNSLKNNILLPKYYNPELETILKQQYESTGNYILKSFQELEDEGIIKITGGHEVGSKEYGTGNIPFIRTSEIANWEITHDPMHCVSEEIYEEYKKKQNIQPEDILIVKDGGHLVGKTAMITDLDLKIIIQSHFRKITVLKKDILSPYVLLGSIGLDIVQKQIKSKTFTQSTIPTLGNRLKEVYLPLITNEKKKKQIDKTIKNTILMKRNANYISNTELTEYRT